jgi:arginyl-tRNA synthetase
MPTIVSQLDAAFRAAIKSAVGFDADPMVSPAQNEKFGDYQANAAMGLAKEVAEKTGQKTNPRALAEQIKSKLDLGEMASEITIAGPGFINVKLAPAWLSRQLQTIAADVRLGVEPSPHPQTVVVDYSGPNVAKQMHVGHLRSTIIGDAISRVLEFEGDNVIRQNHIGDWGTQFGMLISHLAGTTRASEKIEDLEEFYRAAKRRFDEDPAFQDASRQTVVRLQGGGEEERALWQKIVEETRRDYQPIYGRLNVLLKPEHERGESFYNSRLSSVVTDLKHAGIAVESDGAIAVFVDGPEKTPLIIEKTGGGYLYGTTDLAAIRFRVGELHATRIIYTHDSRQAQHFGQVFATAKKAGWADGVSLEYAPFGTMLGEDGRPFKTRTGGTVKLKDLLDEAEERAMQLVTAKNADMPEEQRRSIAQAIGIGAVKYSDLSKDRTSDYVFSWDKMLAMDGNTGPYLQYAYARICSIFRKTEEKPNPQKISLEAPQELSLAKHVFRLADVLQIVSRELKPHHLCLYLYELAQKFSSFYEHCPVLKSDDQTRASRLALCDLTARTMALGLDLLGIEHPTQM